MSIKSFQLYMPLCIWGLAAATVTPAMSQEVQVPGVELQKTGVYTFRVGEIDITALSDGTVPQDLHKLLRGTTEAHTDALLKAAFLKNPVEASINAYLFHIDDRTILVDTGSGDLFPPGFGGKLLQNLAAAGVRPEQVTDILLTHAHDDHMGGLMHAGKMAFPKAEVHVSKSDVDFFADRSNSAKSHYDMSYFDEFFRSLNYYVKAGKVKTFEGTTEILPGVVAVVRPGHTPGSTFYTLHSHDQQIVFVPDMAHVPAVQLPDPSITITYDVNPNEAEKVREQALSDFARDRTLIAVPHFPFPGVGHVRRASPGFEWIPIDYTNRLVSQDQISRSKSTASGNE